MISRETKLSFQGFACLAQQSALFTNNEEHVACHVNGSANRVISFLQHVHFHLIRAKAPFSWRSCSLRESTVFAKSWARS